MRGTEQHPYCEGKHCNTRAKCRLFERDRFIGGICGVVVEDGDFVFTVRDKDGRGHEFYSNELSVYAGEEV